MSSFGERSALLGKVCRALRKKFGRQTPEAAEEVAASLVRFVLLEESDRQTVEGAMGRIAEGFVDLNELRVSLPAEIAEVIPGVPQAHRKAARLTQLFNAMFLRHNTMAWEFLRSYGVRELRQYFEKIEGGDAVLGAAAVMMFSPGHAVPADADVRRVLGRLGLTEEGEDIAGLQAFLERAVTREQGYETWALLHRLGESLCAAGEPLCGRCLLRSACPTGCQAAAKKAGPPVKRKAAGASASRKAAGGKRAKAAGSKRKPAKGGRKRSSGR